MMIPNACLAAILIMTGYKLTKLVLFKEYYRKGIDQFLPFIVTIVVMLLSDLLKGVGAGLLVAIFFIIRNNVTFSFEIIEENIDGQKHYLIKLPQHITFFNKGFVVKYLNRIGSNSRVIIDGSINKSTDKDVKEVFLDFIEIAKEKNIEVQFVKYSLTR
jgi:MFS superfamily sulfate permease-like transporter